jgi:hypothetical protein
LHNACRAFCSCSPSSTCRSTHTHTQHVNTCIHTYVVPAVPAPQTRDTASVREYASSVSTPAQACFR